MLARFFSCQNYNSFGRFNLALYLSLRHFSSSRKSTELLRHHGTDASFDICKTRNGRSLKLNSDLAEEDDNQQKQLDISKKKCQHCLLRNGMVLLKNYITYTDQIKIIEVCRDIGLSHSGFYQPSFRNGAKMHLQMMCLGKIWDPVTRLYKNRRSDGSSTPPIPEGFKVLVERAIQDSYILIEKDQIGNNPEDILPRMNPDICIVNFYTKSGRLGLHQDNDESERSLHKGLPVISFSIGDSAEFLYGDERDTNKVQRVVLESGDVLLFGGQARHIFHGVSSIIPNSAPRVLVKKANLRPGRLNLTFREY